VSTRAERVHAKNTAIVDHRRKDSKSKCSLCLCVEEVYRAA
jgi:hypothetical protein